MAEQRTVHSPWSVGPASPRFWADVRGAVSQSIRKIRGAVGPASSESTDEPIKLAAQPLICPPDDKTSAEILVRSAGLMQAPQPLVMLKHLWLAQLDVPDRREKAALGIFDSSRLLVR